MTGTRKCHINNVLEGKFNFCMRLEIVKQYVEHVLYTVIWLHNSSVII